MNNIETIKNRVRKLLALSKSDNEHEAAAALEKANALIAEYELDEEGLRFETAEVKSNKTYVPWRAAVANAVSWLYGCYHYRDRDKGTMVFAGEPLDVFMAAEMYAYLARTIERYAKKNIRKNAKYRFRQDFKRGMAGRLYDRITELGAACSWSSRRNLKMEEARDWAEKQASLCDSKTGATGKTKLNRTAFAKGKRLGDGVSLARQAGYSGEGVARITAPRPLAQGELFGTPQWQCHNPD